jgi:hypothetical protein
MSLPLSLERGLVIVDCKTIDVCHADVMSTLAELRANADTYRGRNFLILDPGTSYMPTAGQVREFADSILALLNGVFPCIALVVAKPVHLGLGRMAEVFAQARRGEFRTFIDEGEARTWLAGCLEDREGA